MQSWCSEKLTLWWTAVLSSMAAKVWAKYTSIQNVWGATEALAAPQLTADNEDYAYVYFDTFIDGYEFRPVGDTGYVSEGGEAEDLFEFVMKITSESSPLASWHARQNIDLSNTPPPLPEWQTGDLWTPHPDPEKKAYAWKFVCRKDDLISFSTGTWPLDTKFSLAALLRSRDTSIRGV